MLAAGVISAVTLGRLYPPRGPARLSLGNVATRETFAPVLLSLPFPVIWSMMDFQGYPDFFVFIPYVAIGFGGVLLFGAGLGVGGDGGRLGGGGSAFGPVMCAPLGSEEG